MISWKRALLFNREGLVSNEGGGGGHPIGVIGFDGRQGVSKKFMGMGSGAPHAPIPPWDTLNN